VLSSSLVLASSVALPYRCAIITMPIVTVDSNTPRESPINEDSKGIKMD